jgi:hypothetical protein
VKSRIFYKNPRKITSGGGLYFFLENSLLRRFVIIMRIPITMRMEAMPVPM